MEVLNSPVSYLLIVIYIKIVKKYFSGSQTWNYVRSISLCSTGILECFFLTCKSTSTNFTNWDFKKCKCFRRAYVLNWYTWRYYLSFEIIYMKWLDTFAWFLGKWTIWTYWTVTSSSNVSLLVALSQNRPRRYCSLFSSSLLRFAWFISFRTLMWQRILWYRSYYRSKTTFVLSNWY